MGISRSYVSRIETKAIEKLADGFRIKFQNHLQTLKKCYNNK